jgi:4-hydroxy-tetrahydrodipicolinate synthase
LRLLPFAEPSPARIKFALRRIGLIDSPEPRLPMTPVSDSPTARIDYEIARWEALKVSPEESQGLP